MKRLVATLFSAAMVLTIAAGCGGSADAGGDADAPPAQNGGSTADAPLSAKEMEQGIGPIHDMGELPPVDADLVAAGEEHFQLFCSACHKLTDRYVGPELGQVLSRRTPEFVMNMVLNANEMVERHPAVREMLAEYFTPMAQQNVSEEQARAILEYLRANQTG